MRSTWLNSGLNIGEFFPATFDSIATMPGQPYFVQHVNHKNLLPLTATVNVAAKNINGLGNPVRAGDNWDVGYSAPRIDQMRRDTLAVGHLPYYSRLGFTTGHDYNALAVNKDSPKAPLWLTLPLVQLTSSNLGEQIKYNFAWDFQIWPTWEASSGNEAAYFFGARTWQVQASGTLTWTEDPPGNLKWVFTPDPSGSNRVYATSNLTRNQANHWDIPLIARPFSSEAKPTWFKNN